MAPNTTRTIKCKAWNSPVEYPSRKSEHYIKESEGNMFNSIFNGNIQGRKHPGRCAFSESELPYFYLPYFHVSNGALFLTSTLVLSLYIYIIFTLSISVTSCYEPTMFNVYSDSNIMLFPYQFIWICRNTLSIHMKWLKQMRNVWWISNFIYYLAINVPQRYRVCWTHYCHDYNGLPHKIY